jgi:hypothetical protein
MHAFARAPAHEARAVRREALQLLQRSKHAIITHRLSWHCGAVFLLMAGIDPGFHRYMRRAFFCRTQGQLYQGMASEVNTTSGVARRGVESTGGECIVPPFLLLILLASLPSSKLVSCPSAIPKVTWHTIGCCSSHRRASTYPMARSTVPRISGHPVIIGSHVLHDIHF